MASNGLAVAEKLVAVVGAGASGLVCASRLAELGFRVMIFDSGRGPGGRMSQRRERNSDGKLYYFDHGAQYFSVKDDTVKQLVRKWEDEGIVAEWKGQFGSYNTSTKRFIEDSDLQKKRYVGVPGMNAICQALSRQPGIEAKYAVTVGKLDWQDENNVWTLSDKEGKILGDFSAVVATDKNMASPRFSIQNGLPPPLVGAGLLPGLAEKVASVTSSSSFAVMLVFPHLLTSIPFDGFSIIGSNILAWAARDSSKPGREKLECWVLQSTPEYAQKIIQKYGMGKPSDELLSNVINDLLEHFKEIGDIPAPIYAKAHRWGSAFPITIIGEEEKCLIDENKRIAICGDFCAGPRIEYAILSGLSAAAKIQKLFNSDSRM